MDVQAELWWATGHGLGESARWFAGAYHWVDIETGSVLRARPAGPLERTEIGGTVSAVFDAGDGCEGVVAGDRILVLREGRIEKEYPLPDLADRHGRTNDARVDPLGRLWVGTVGRGSEARAAVLWRLDAQGPTVVRSGLTLSNGLDFDAAGTAYHADTFDHVVYRYRLGPDGAIAQVEEAVRVDGLPDGLCVDAADGLWIALWGGGRAERYDRDGRRTHVIRTPGASQVTSLCFGGSHLDEVLLTTAAEDVDEPHAGAVFRARVDIAGRAESTWIPEQEAGARDD
ncbi:SMP-30/gluconolactonase/LRE family protein [Microbacterium lushaniae]|nr:SMP-30/gluconolactonase/LRE family protein [Microbacterium lushaniae]KAA9158315.1 SMP-30/gluconolactonase/LRE family protein [Microbacterium lushaniae]